MASQSVARDTCVWVGCVARVACWGRCAARVAGGARVGWSVRMRFAGLGMRVGNRVVVAVKICWSSLTSCWLG